MRAEEAGTGRRHAPGDGPGAPVDQPPEVVIRVARINDADSIGDLHVRSWQVGYAGIIPATVLDRLSPTRRAAYWRDAIARQTARPGSEKTWVVEVDGRVLGFAASGVARDDDVPVGAGEFHAIYLAPEAWSQGLGGRLFEYTVEQLDALGFDPLVLWVIGTNERARAFYERRGWQPDGACRTLDFDGTPIDEVRYRRVMPTPDR
jgi:GNAT superfamily N-acetyltransferase